MPCGEYTKDRIREIAKEIGLAVHNKKDSEEICFIPDNNHGRYISEARPLEVVPGNFVDKNTIIISLINGISSEDKIRSAYPNTTVLNSYFIGHSAMKLGNKFYQDGIGKIVFEPNESLENFFKEIYKSPSKTLAFFEKIQ